jgi:subfamily B ATP-binding cassette protein MsbA
MLRLAKYIKGYRRYIFFNVVINLISLIFSLVSLSLIVPFLELLFERVGAQLEPVPLAFTTESMTQNFNYYLYNIILEYGKEGALFRVAILVVMLFFLKNLFRYLGQYLIAPMRVGVIADLRNVIYRKILILPLAYFSAQRKGDVLSRIANDVNDVEWSIMNAIMMFLRDPLSIALYLAVLLMISPMLTLVIFLLLPVVFLLIRQIGKMLNRYSAKGQKRLGRLIAMIEESIHGLKIIKAYQVIGRMTRDFERRNSFYTRLMNRVYRYRDLSHPITEFLAITMLVVILAIGGRLVLGNDPEMSANVFIFYLVVFSQLIPPAKNLITAYYYIEKGMASLDRIEEILNAEEIIMEVPGALAIDSLKEKIEYKDVSFTYSGDYVVQNINIVLNKGQKTAIVGPSGAGKSTLVDLLSRFYDVQEGRIEIDGIDIRKLKISDLRSLSGIVSQETILFNDTVYNNIAFGYPGATPEKVKLAAGMANAHGFIMEMPEGYDTNIGDRGIRLSGGQRQRLSIARAILRDPEILILDEATSALDTESERLVQEALVNAMEGRTAIIIAHRLATVQIADEILVLKKGRIVEQGTHKQLYDQNGMYRKLCDLQFNI